jgi:hypothetical protein
MDDALNRSLVDAGDRKKEKSTHPNGSEGCYSQNEQVASDEMHTP